MMDIKTLLEIEKRLSRMMRESEFIYTIGLVRALMLIEQMKIDCGASSAVTRGDFVNCLQCGSRIYTNDEYGIWLFNVTKWKDKGMCRQCCEEEQKKDETRP
jgi:hypothetical protein